MRPEHSQGEIVSDIVRFSALARGCAVLLSVMAASVIVSVSPFAAGATVSYTGAGCSSFSLSGTPPNQTLICVTGGGGSVPVCAPTAKPASPAVSQSTTISANCSDQPTSYVWTGGACLGITASACAVTKNKAASVTFTVQATNAAGQGSPAQITVTWH